MQSTLKEKRERSWLDALVGLWITGLEGQVSRSKRKIGIKRFEGMINPRNATTYSASICRARGE
jgi:hypothetical protein